MAKILVATDGREWQAWVEDDFSTETIAAVEGSGFFDGVSVYVLLDEPSFGKDEGCHLLVGPVGAMVVPYDTALLEAADGSTVLGGLFLVATGFGEVSVEKGELAAWLAEMVAE